MTIKQHYRTIAEACARRAREFENVAELHEMNGEHKAAADCRAWAAWERAGEAYHRHFAGELAKRGAFQELAP